MLWNFLKNFYGTPERYFNDYSIEHVIRCEATHFLSSAVVAFLVYLLIWTILSRSRYRCHDRYIFRFSLLCGLCASVTVHICVDAFTTLA